MALRLLSFDNRNEAYSILKQWIMRNMTFWQLGMLQRGVNFYGNLESVV